MSVVVRPASVNDIPIIQHIASLVWPTAYCDILSPRQLSYMLDKMYSQHVLKQQIEQEQHQFFIAENEGPIGFAGASAVSFRVEEKPGAIFWKLHKLYVVPYLQKTGAGKALMEQVITTAKNNNADTLLLNVNRNNPAYNYYVSKGFSIVETGDFDIGAGFYMQDYVMAKNI